MGEIGKVMKTNGTTVEITFTRSEACAKCRACTAGLQKDEMHVTAENACGAEKGDWVEMDLADGHFLKAVLIMYGFPLLMLITGGVGGYFLGKLIKTVNPEALGFILGMSLMTISYLIIAQIDKARKSRIIPVAIRKVNLDGK